LVVASALAHGLLLALPLPESETTEEPEPEEIEILQEQAMNVARLPQSPDAAAADPTPSQPSEPSAPVRQSAPVDPPPRSQTPDRQTLSDRAPETPPRRNPLDGVEQLPPEDGQNSSTPPGEDPELTFSQRLRTPGEYVRDGSGRVFSGDLQTLAFSDPYLTWYEGLTDSPALAPQTVTFSIDYQLDPCDHPLTIPPQRGYLGVVLAADNTVVAVEVIGSTGYTLLDDQAIEALPEHLAELPARATQTAYIAEFTVNNTRCGG
jgi:hypothetical protein